MQLKYDNRTLNGWAKNAIAGFETLYIGDAEPWPSFAGPCIG